MAAQKETHAFMLGAPQWRRDWAPWQHDEYHHLRWRQAEAERALREHPVMADAIERKRWHRLSQALQRAARETGDRAEEPEPAAA